MLRVIIVSAMLALVLSHDSSSSESNENIGDKRGHCPNVSSNSSVSACSTPCPEGANCTNVSCSSDTSCTGDQKCCQTDCGLMCLDPEFKALCEDNDDCPRTLVCCKKSCVTECVAPSHVMPPRNKGKEMKGKHRD